MDCIWFGIAGIVICVLIALLAHIVTRHLETRRCCANCRYYHPVGNGSRGFCQRSTLNVDIIKTLNLTIPGDAVCWDYERKVL